MALDKVGEQDPEARPNMIAQLNKTLREMRERGIYGRHHRQPKAYGPLLKS